MYNIYSMNLYNKYDGSNSLFLRIPAQEARCRWSNVTPPGDDHAGCPVSLPLASLVHVMRGGWEWWHQSRQIHSRLSHEQILEPLHLGLLEQDDGNICSTKPLTKPAMLLWGHRLWHWSQWQRCEDCELAAKSPQVRSPAHGISHVCNGSCIDHYWSCILRFGITIQCCQASFNNST